MNLSEEQPDYFEATTVYQLLNDSAEEPISEECAPKEFTTIPIILILISVLGIVGNLLVIWLIVILQEYKKTITNLYLVQLATSDLLFMVFLPIEATAHVKGSIWFGTYFCKLYQTLRFMSYYSSIFFLTVMSVDRYVAINHAMSHWGAKLRSKRSVYVTSVCVWVLCLACVLPIMVRSKVEGCKCSTDFLDTTESYAYGYNEDYYGEDYYDVSESSGSNGTNITTTYLNLNTTFENNTKPLDRNNVSYSEYGSGWIEDSELSEEEYAQFLRGIIESGDQCSLQFVPAARGTILFNFIGAFTIPLLIICACYASILKKVFQPSVSGAKSSGSQSTRKRVTRMVIVLVTTFIICWLPYHVFQLMKFRGVAIAEADCDTVGESLSILAYANSVFNPLMYTFMGSNIRKRWKEMLRRTRSFRPSIGSRSDYQPGKGAKKYRSQTGDSMGNSFSKSNMKHNQTHISRVS